MASNSKTVSKITSSIRKMTISPEQTAIHKIIINPGKYIAAFNILLRAWIRANILSIDHTLGLICDELLSYEMPPEFMLWYFDERRPTIAKFNKFNMFREQHGDKIKAVNVIQQSHLPVATDATYRPVMSAIAAADAFGPRGGGRKKRTQHRRMRRTRIIRTRRHRAQNRKSRK